MYCCMCGDKIDKAYKIFHTLKYELWFCSKNCFNELNDKYQEELDVYIRRND